LPSPPSRPSSVSWCGTCEYIYISLFAFAVVFENLHALLLAVRCEVAGRFPSRGDGLWLPFFPRKHQCVAVSFRL